MRLANTWRRGHRGNSPRLFAEQLEERCMLAGNPHAAVYFTPSQIQKAYGFDQLAGNGAGQKIAIVDAYNAPNLRADLAKFDNLFLGAPANEDTFSFLTVVDQTGGTNYPQNNTSWSQEIALDVEWAHAIAPGASILLVEANDTTDISMYAAVDYAAQSGASVVSMSWGRYEFAQEATYDHHFNVPNVAFIASSGDTGAVVQYPAVSPLVVGVGGASLKLNSDNSYNSETGWSGSGGGISNYEPIPSYQVGVGTGSSTKRSSPDVAYDADPNTGVVVVWNGTQYIFGGTSAGAPQWAGLVAIANQSRGALPPLNSASLLAALYSAPSSSFHDIINGKSGVGRNALSAKAGYDLVTGLGSPNVSVLMATLAGAGTKSFATTTGAPALDGSAGMHIELQIGVSAIAGQFPANAPNTPIEATLRDSQRLSGNGSDLHSPTVISPQSRESATDWTRDLNPLRTASETGVLENGMVVKQTGGDCALRGFEPAVNPSTTQARYRSSFLVAAISAPAQRAGQFTAAHGFNGSQSVVKIDEQSDDGNRAPEPMAMRTAANPSFAPPATLKNSASWSNMLWLASAVLYVTHNLGELRLGLNLDATAAQSRRRIGPIRSA